MHPGTSPPLAYSAGRLIAVGLLSVAGMLGSLVDTAQ